MNESKIKELLIKSLDADLSAAEEERLRSALESDAELRRLKEQLMQTQELMYVAPGEVGEEDDRAFTNAVMDKIRLEKADANSSEVDFATQLHRIFPRFAVACCGLWALLLLGVYITEGRLGTDELMGLSSLMEDAYLSDPFFMEN